MSEQSNNIVAELKESVKDLDITSHFWTQLYSGFIILERAGLHDLNPRVSIGFVPKGWEKGEGEEFLNGAAALLDDIIARRKKKDKSVPKDLVD